MPDAQNDPDTFVAGFMQRMTGLVEAGGGFAPPTVIPMVHGKHLSPIVIRERGPLEDFELARRRIAAEVGWSGCLFAYAQAIGEGVNAVVLENHPSQGPRASLVRRFTIDGAGRVVWRDMAPIDGPPPAPRLSTKAETVMGLLERGCVRISVDTRVPGVDVPPSFMGKAAVLLDIGWSLPEPIPDLVVDGVGVEGTLGFADGPYSCLVPWSAITGVTLPGQAYRVWNVPQGLLSGKVPIAASPAEGGLVLRTRGVHAHDHPELEIRRVPQTGAKAAAHLINALLSSVVDEGKALLAGEHWGGDLRVRAEDPDPELAVALVARQAEPGVLALFDAYPPDAMTTHRAIATMMVHQASRLVAGGDAAAAAALLREAIAIFPGAHGAGAPPVLDLRGDVNWQNHLAYLRLADITPDPAEAEYLRHDVYTRVEWLAERDLGGAPAAVRAALGVHDTSSLMRLAREILDHNVASPHVERGAREGVRLVASPVWSRGEGGQAIRRLCTLPAGFAVMYLGAHLADPETAELIARRTCQLVEEHGARPCELAKHTAIARQDCAEAGTLVVDTGRPYELVHFIVSACVATATRELYAAMRGDDFDAWVANERAARSNEAPGPDPSTSDEGALEPDDTSRTIRHVVSTNMFDFELASLGAEWEVVLSPLWEPGPNGKAIRRAVLIPRSMRAHYFEGAARQALERDDVADIVAAIAAQPDPSRPLTDLFALYSPQDAPWVELDEPWTADLGGLTLLLADIARRARVGLTSAQMLDADFASPSASRALERLDAFEHEHVKQLARAPVEELVRALKELPRLRMPPPGTSFH